MSSPSDAQKPCPRSSGGILIAMEGIDGAGKTTQVRMLLAKLRANGREALATKEPTSGKWGKKIRLSASAGRLPLQEELQAFLEDRREHVRDELLPALERGEVVIVDRYYISTVAYQGARGMDPVELFQYNAFAPVPDLLFVLDVPPKVGLARVAKRGDIADQFEKEDELTKARSIFRDQELLSRYVPDVHILDGTRSEEDLGAAITALVFGRLGDVRK